MLLFARFLYMSLLLFLYFYCALNFFSFFCPFPSEILELRCKREISPQSENAYSPKKKCVNGEEKRSITVLTPMKKRAIQNDTQRKPIDGAKEQGEKRKNVLVQCKHKNNCVKPGAGGEMEREATWKKV